KLLKQALQHETRGRKVQGRHHCSPGYATCRHHCPAACQCNDLSAQTLHPRTVIKRLNNSGDKLRAAISLPNWYPCLIPSIGNPVRSVLGVALDPGREGLHELAEKVARACVRPLALIVEQSRRTAHIGLGLL